MARSARRSAASSSRSQSASVMVQLGRDLLDVRPRQQGRGQREPHRVDQLPEETTRVIGLLLVIAMYSLLVFAGVLAVAGCGR
jgi:hypothetical protein